MENMEPLRPIKVENTMTDNLDYIEDFIKEEPLDIKEEVEEAVEENCNDETAEGLLETELAIMESFTRNANFFKIKIEPTEDTHNINELEGNESTTFRPIISDNDYLHTSTSDDDDSEETLSSIATRKRRKRRKKTRFAKRFRSPRAYSCSECDYSTEFSSLLKSHKLVHSNEKPFQCPHCDYSSRYISNLNTHIRRKRCNKGTKSHKEKHNIESKEFLCSEDSPIINPSQQSDGKTYKCNVCGDLFPDIEILRAHENSAKCQVRVESEEKGSISERLKLPSNEETRALTETFQQMENKSKNTTTVTKLNEKLLKCDKCEYTSKFFASMKSHEAVHSGERPYVCGKCNFPFKYKGNLTAHVKNKRCSTILKRIRKMKGKHIDKDLDVAKLLGLDIKSTKIVTHNRNLRKTRKGQNIENVYNSAENADDNLTYNKSEEEEGQILKGKKDRKVSENESKNEVNIHHENKNAEEFNNKKAEENIPFTNFENKENANSLSQFEGRSRSSHKHNLRRNVSQQIIENIDDSIENVEENLICNKSGVKSKEEQKLLPSEDKRISENESKKGNVMYENNEKELDKKKDEENVPFTNFENEEDASLASNLKVRRQSSRKPFKCLKCGRNFTQYKSLKYHLKNKVCTKNRKLRKTRKKGNVSFTDGGQDGERKERLQSRVLHEVDISEEESNNYTDKESDQSSRKLEDVSLSTHDANDKQFHCTKCEYTTSSRSRLNVHESMHSGIKHYKCSKCNFGSMYKSRYIQHTRSKTCFNDYNSADNDKEIFDPLSSDVSFSDETDNNTNEKVSLSRGRTLRAARIKSNRLKEKFNSGGKQQKQRTLNAESNPGKLMEENNLLAVDENSHTSASKGLSDFIDDDSSDYENSSVSTSTGSEDYKESVLKTKKRKRRKTLDIDESLTEKESDTDDSNNSLEIQVDHSRRRFSRRIKNKYATSSKNNDKKNNLSGSLERSDGSESEESTSLNTKISQQNNNSKNIKESREGCNYRSNLESLEDSEGEQQKQGILNAENNSEKLTEENNLLTVDENSSHTSAGKRLSDVVDDDFDDYENSSFVSTGGEYYQESGLRANKRRKTLNLDKSLTEKESDIDDSNKLIETQVAHSVRRFSRRSKNKSATSPKNDDDKINFSGSREINDKSELEESTSVNAKTRQQEDNHENIEKIREDFNYESNLDETLHSKQSLETEDDKLLFKFFLGDSENKYEDDVLIQFFQKPKVLVKKLQLRYCTHCDFVSHSICRLRNHKFATHFKSKKFYCSECNFSSITRRTLMSHEETHKTNEGEEIISTKEKASDFECAPVEETSENETNQESQDGSEECSSVSNNSVFNEDEHSNSCTSPVAWENSPMNMENTQNILSNNFDGEISSQFAQIDHCNKKVENLDVNHIQDNIYELVNDKVTSMLGDIVPTNNFDGDISSQFAEIDHNKKAENLDLNHIQDSIYKIVNDKVTSILSDLLGAKFKQKMMEKFALKSSEKNSQSEQGIDKPIDKTSYEYISKALELYKGSLSDSGNDSDDIESDSSESTQEENNLSSEDNSNISQEVLSELKDYLNFKNINVDVKKRSEDNLNSQVKINDILDNSTAQVKDEASSRLTFSIVSDVSELNNHCSEVNAASSEPSTDSSVLNAVNIQERKIHRNSFFSYDPYSLESMKKYIVIEAKCADDVSNITDKKSESSDDEIMIIDEVKSTSDIPLHSKHLSSNDYNAQLQRVAAARDKINFLQEPSNISEPLSSHLYKKCESIHFPHSDQPLVKGIHPITESRCKISIQRDLESNRSEPTIRNHTNANLNMGTRAIPNNYSNRQVLPGQSSNISFLPNADEFVSFNSDSNIVVFPGNMNINVQVTPSPSIIYSNRGLAGTPSLTGTPEDANNFYSKLPDATNKYELLNNIRNDWVNHNNDLEVFSDKVKKGDGETCSSILEERLRNPPRLNVSKTEIAREETKFIPLQEGSSEANAYTGWSSKNAISDIAGQSINSKSMFSQGEYSSQQVLISPVEKANIDKPPNSKTNSNPKAKKLGVKYECYVCHLVCSELSISNHLKRVHKLNILYKCDQCNYTSLLKHAVKKHMLTHLNNS